MSFGTKQATEKVKNQFVSKKINPGNHRCKVNGVYVKEVEDTRKGGTLLQLWLTLETEPIGGDFKGWAIDKNDESKGFALGQIGNVKSNPFGYKTEEANGVKYVREASIATFLHILCLEATGSRWVEEVDGKYKTFEEFIAAFNEANPIKDVYLDWCIGGRKVINEEGYADYWLNLPKIKKGEKAFKNPSKVGNLVKFDEVLHIYDKTNTESVEGFGNAQPLAKPAEAPKPKWDTEEDETETEVEEVEFAAPSELATDDDDPFAIDETTDDDPFGVD
jgi:hypothetical protein